MLNIIALPAFSSNYIWILYNAKNCIAVDPGDSNIVNNFLQQHNLTLTAILVTHHHWDHIGGIAKLHKLHPNIKIYAPYSNKINTVTHRLQQNDILKFVDLSLNFKIIATPGHNLDHIIYYDQQQQILFCVDTLFSAVCGKMFEGNAKKFHHSLT